MQFHGLSHTSPEGALPFPSPASHAQALPCACTQALAKNTLLAPWGWQEASQTVPFSGSSAFTGEVFPQHTSSPAPIPLSAFVDSTNAGTVLALVPHKPGKV